MSGDAIDMSMNTLMHGAFKRELARIRSGVLSMPELTPEQVSGLVRRWRFFEEQLEHHHQAEDRYIWPLVRERISEPEDVVVIDAMESEHQALHSQMQVLNQSFEKVSIGQTVDSDELVAQLDDLKVIVTGHCDHEERAGARLAEAYVKSDDLAEFHKFTRSGENSSLVFPWVCDGASQSDQKKTWGVLPGFVRVVAKPIMTRKYRAFVATLD